MSEIVTACMADLCLEHKHLSKVRQVQVHAADLPMGGSQDLEKLLYMRVRAAEYPQYCKADGSFKSVGLGIAFWWSVGSILWDIIRWWIANRQK